MGSEQWTGVSGRKSGMNGDIAAPRGKTAGRACKKRRAGGIGVRQVRPRQSVRQHKPRPPADRPPLFTRALCGRPSIRRAARQNHWAVLRNHWAIFSRDAGDFFTRCASLDHEMREIFSNLWAAWPVVSFRLSVVRGEWADGWDEWRLRRTAREEGGARV
ncbi:MAG: hypothetical protein LBD07_05415, partial [Spirochaetaceae bacterium]|nr:hypothetical protein [Spirochaetaceae bacterium]